jgi:hypothetical protein
MRVINYYGANYILASEVYGALGVLDWDDMVTQSHKLWACCMGEDEHTLPSQVINYIQSHYAVVGAASIGLSPTEEKWLHISFAIHLCLLSVQKGYDNNGKVTVLFKKLNHTLYSRSDRMDGEV